MKRLKKALSPVLALLIALSFSQLFFVGARNDDDYYFDDEIINESSVKMLIGEKKVIGDKWETFLDYYDRFDIEYDGMRYNVVDVVSSNPSVLKVEKKSYGWEFRALSAGTVTVTVYDNGGYYDFDYDDDYYYDSDLDEYYGLPEFENEYDGVYDIFTVTVSKISAGKISCSNVADQSYTGSEIKPAVKLSYKKTELKDGKDYTVSYQNNVKVGTATLTVKLIGNYAGTITKKFNILPSISKTSATIYYGSTIKLTVKSSEKVTWSTSDSKIAKVSQNGVVTPMKAGKATITAVSGGKKLSCALTVKPRSLDPGSKKVYLGQSFTLKYNGGSGEVKWTSSNTKVAKVDKNGVVTTVGAGKATITAVRNKIALNCMVEVVYPKLNCTTMNIYAGYKKTLTLKGATGKTAWKSGNQNIAIVNQKGVVKGIRKGTAVIYAVNNGRTYKCTVNVKNLPAITINYVDWTTNSADGVEPKITITNNTKKDIKYIDFTMYFYNRVGDLTYCEIQNQCYKNLRIVGPFYAKRKDTFYWDPVFYNNHVSAIRVKNVVVEFMDGTKQKLPYNTLWYDKYYYYK